MFQKYASAAISVCLLQSAVAEIPPESIQSEGSAGEEIGVKLEARGDDCARIKELANVCGAYRQMENDIFELFAPWGATAGTLFGAVEGSFSKSFLYRNAKGSWTFTKMQQNIQKNKGTVVSLYTNSSSPCHESLTFRYYHNSGGENGGNSTSWKLADNFRVECNVSTTRGGKESEAETTERVREAVEVGAINELQNSNAEANASERHDEDREDLWSSAARSQAEAAEEKTEAFAALPHAENASTPWSANAHRNESVVTGPGRFKAPASAAAPFSAVDASSAGAAAAASPVIIRRVVEAEPFLQLQRQQPPGEGIDPLPVPASACPGRSPGPLSPSSSSGSARRQRIAEGGGHVLLVAAVSKGTAWAMRRLLRFQRQPYPLRGSLELPPTSTADATLVLAPAEATTGDGRGD